MHFEQMMQPGIQSQYETLEDYLDDFLALVSKKIKTAVLLTEIDQENVIVHSLGVYRADETSENEKLIGVQLHFAVSNLEKLNEVLKDEGAPAWPPNARPSRVKRSLSRMVLRPCGATSSGKRSQKMRCAQSICKQKNLRACTTNCTAIPSHGRSATCRL